MNSPVLSLREMAAFRLQLVFDQERHHIGQAHRLLFGISETSDIFTLDQRLTVRDKGFTIAPFYGLVMATFFKASLFVNKVPSRYGCMLARFHSIERPPD